MKVKHSFATTFNKKTGEFHSDTYRVAMMIVSKGWGNIPKRINDTRAMEIYLLARAYLALIKKLERGINETKGTPAQHARLALAEYEAEV